MPSGRPPVKFTYAEYKTLPEGSRHQLIEGDLIVSPAPTRRHQTVVKRLFRALDAFVNARALGEVYFSPIDVLLSDEDVAQPDIVYVSKGSAATLVPEGVRGGPDLCVEVLSSRTEALDRGAKRILYARHGVTEYWIVDPETNFIDVFRLQEDPHASARRLLAADTLTSDLFTGLSVGLRDVFAP